MDAKTEAVLALADGRLFRGRAAGAEGLAVGEVVFNTALSGYQEILTDPSYAGQLVTLTCPHIGNVGVNPDDEESERIHAAGLIVRDLPRRPSSWRASAGLPEYLRERGVVGIAGIDTRALTRVLRDGGAQSGAILAGADVDPAKAVAAARACPSLAGTDLARVVTCHQVHVFEQGEYDLERRCFGEGSGRFRVVAYDFGAKRNILRMLVSRGCALTVVPATTPAETVLAMRPDGVFLSNGPGDPAACGYAVDAVRRLLAAQLPIFGICLGHQILALAAGARTVKMKFGHHGANHPVLDLASGRVAISSQNHGFAVDEASLPNEVTVTHRSLFDGSNQGIALAGGRAFSFQGHPEASPGPHDLAPLFDRFVDLLRHAQAH